MTDKKPVRKNKKPALPEKPVPNRVVHLTEAMIGRIKTAQLVEWVENNDKVTTELSNVECSGTLIVLNGTKYLQYVTDVVASITTKNRCEVVAFY